MLETIYTLPSCPVCAALLADSHNRPVDGAPDSLRLRRPDLILLAGDFVYAAPPKAPGVLKMRESRPALELMEACAALAPTFVSLGNHEWMLHEKDLDLIADTGVTVLDNRFVSLTVRDVPLCVGGLSSAHVSAYQAWREAQSDPAFYPDPPGRIWAGDPPPELGWLDGFEEQEAYKILLCHHPEYAPRYLSHRRLDLILSGHAHGGQWRYFSRRKQTWRGVYAPGQGLFPPRTEGVHGNQVISRGMSNTAHIPRLWNPPELVYINYDPDRAVGSVLR